MTKTCAEECEPFTFTFKSCSGDAQPPVPWRHIVEGADKSVNRTPCRRGSSREFRTGIYAYKVFEYEYRQHKRNSKRGRPAIGLAPRAPNVYPPYGVWP